MAAAGMAFMEGAGRMPRGGEEEPGKMRLTPMELDIQLQAAELIFRSILEGKRLGIHPAEDVDEWHRQVLGEAWVQQNMKQRKEVRRQTKASGENTPEWIESLENMAEIAWECFIWGNKGERLRRLKDIDRTEVVEQFKELFPKVRDSYYARCGAGDRLGGLRACIGVFRLFIQDTQVLDLCASCLKHVITDHEYNRDGLAELYLPLPPEERSEDSPERGWSFLRAALDAFMVQAGCEPFSWRPEDDKPADSDEEEESSDEKPPQEAVDRTPRRQVAVRIAECIVAVRSAPAAMVQLNMLREAVPSTACVEWRELQQMLPIAYEKAQELNSQEPHPALMALLEMLKNAGASEQPPVAVPPDMGDGDGGPGSGSDFPGGGGLDDPTGSGGKKGMLRGLAAGVRGLLGRGSAA